MWCGMVFKKFRSTNRREGKAIKYGESIRQAKNEIREKGPGIDSIRAEAARLGRGIEIGRTAFFDEMGVSSELEYKRQAVKDGRIMAHAHIGMSSWQATADALKKLYAEARKRGVLVDRYGLCLDRRMGLPAQLRGRVPAETGPTLNTPEDWRAVARLVPIQPHMGDFMIGFPASVENTMMALQAGVTTIGNLSQYFSMQAPLWRDQVATAAETVKALAVLGSLREKGVMLHSYLEDGLGALFYDCATVAGWAMLERYLAEELLGAKLTHCNGGLTSDPLKRAGWIFALDRIHSGDCVGSMFYGDTISFSEDFEWNRGMVAEYMLWDAMAQVVCPTGHALHPLPVTEAVRVPSGEEIIDAHIFARRVIETAQRMAPQVDFSGARDFADQIVEGGNTVCRKALDGLREAGVDTANPLEMLYVLKRLGAAAFEDMFGAGKPGEGFPRGRMPVAATDVFEHTRVKKDRILEEISPGLPGMAEGKTFVLASTDVHEHALFLLHQLLQEAGARIINLGPEMNTGQIATAVKDHAPDGLVISTHNGMALEYACKLKRDLERMDCPVPVFIGGRLNQKYEDRDMPVDVEEEIRELGFHPCREVKEIFSYLKA